MLIHDKSLAIFIVVLMFYSYKMNALLLVKRAGASWVSAGKRYRAHFEVKSNWVMSKGYKLGGKVIVTFNRKLKVQLIVTDDTKEAEIVQKR